jgi:hypothetical protein
MSVSLSKQLLQLCQLKANENVEGERESETEVAEGRRNLKEEI